MPCSSCVLLPMPHRGSASGPDSIRACFCCSGSSKAQTMMPANSPVRCLGEIDSLWVFLDEAGVEPTNNRAERALRFAVLWRKRSNGTQSEKGNRWVERF